MQAVRVAFWACAFMACVAVAQVKCEGTVSDTRNKKSYYYDLSSLYHDDTGTDVLWYRADDDVIYYVNLCGQSSSSCDTPDTSVCIRKEINDPTTGTDYEWMSGGKTSTQTISIAEASGQSPSSSVTVSYTGGDKCGSGQYSTKLYINCQTDAHPGYFYNINKKNDCEVTLFMWSAAGCGKEVPYVGPSVSGGDTVAVVILVLLLVGIVVYFAAGAVYQWRVKEAHSASEFIIHREFWMSLPGLIKDGCLFIAHGFKRGDYISV